MAQGAAACCPNGCGEERLRRAGIDELLVLERDAVAAVHDANLDLQFAQARAAVSVLDTDDPKMHLPQKGHREDMEMHLEEDRNFVPLRSKFSNANDDRVRIRRNSEYESQQKRLLRAIGDQDSPEIFEF